MKRFSSVFIVFVAVVSTAERLSVFGQDAWPEESSMQTDTINNEGPEKSSVLSNETNDDIVDASDFLDANQSKGLDDDYAFNNFKSAENGSTEGGGGGGGEEEGNGGGGGDREKSGFVHELSETWRKAVDFLSKAFSSSPVGENSTVPEQFDVGSFQGAENETSVTRAGPSVVSADGQNLEFVGGTGSQFSASTLSHIETSENGLQGNPMTSPLEGISITPSIAANPKTYTAEATPWTPEQNWTSVSGESSQQQPTWIDAGGMCFAEFVNSDDSAACMTGNASMETALLSIFNDTIIRKLAKKCMPGEWCLSHHPHWKHEPETKHGFCSVLPCIQNWKDDGGCPAFSAVSRASGLLCNLSQSDVDGPCLVSVRMMTHVIIADVIRVMIQTEDEGLFCSKAENMKECTGSCRKASHDLHCMCTSCDHNMTLFEGMEEWQWMFKMKDATERCQLNVSDCSLFDSNSIKTHSWSMDPTHGALVKLLMNNEWQLAIGLAFSVVFSLLVVCAIFVGLRCNRNRRLRRRLKRRSASLGGEPSFREDAYTRDRIQYTIITTQPDDCDEYDD